MMLIVELYIIGRERELDVHARAFQFAIRIDSIRYANRFV